MSWVVSIAFTISLVVSATLLNVAQMAGEANAKGEVSAMSGNMVTYHQYVVSYAAANPAATGVVSDSLLGLPAWFVRNTSVLNYVSGGKGYVYVVSPRPELAYQLAKDTKNSIYVGVKSSGVVVSPLSGPLGITVPSAIPDGVTIYAQ